MSNNALSRVVWKVSLPIIFVEATETLDHLIDTIFLARVGVTELGAIAVADSILFLFLVSPLALVDGIQILTARRAGQRRPEAVGAAFNQGFIFVLLICCASTIAMKLLSPVVAAWFVESDALGTAVDAYLQIDAYSIPLTGATFAYSALLISLGKTRVLLPATLILIISDVVLNYIFIFGNFGYPALGMRGAAVGSVGAELLTAIFLTVYAWRRLASRYGVLHFQKFDRRITALLGRLSAPIAVQGFLEDLRWFLFFLIFERVSAQALAIANIVYTCYIVFCVPMTGFSETACSMVSRFVGKNREHWISGVLRKAIVAAIIATVPFIVLALLAPHWLLAVFSPEPDLLEQSSAGLRIVALAMLIAIPGHMWFVAVLGTGDTAASVGIELVLTLTMLGITYFAAIHLGWPVEFAWASLPISWLLGLTISYGWVKSGFWKRLEI